MSLREPTLREVAPGIVLIDTRMADLDEFNAVYLLTGDEPTLVETGPAADAPVVLAALAGLGLDADDLAHLVVTHIHLDHAGGAGSLLPRYPRADVWVHERGAPHLADPSRLVASTARTYGEDRMRAFFGDTEPVDADRIRVVADGDRIPLGDRTLDVLYTPGHASHHVALHDDATGALFTGEAIGSHLPWADCYRPALPPPEVDVEAALASIGVIEARGASALMTSHFGPVDDAAEGCERAAARIVEWSDTVRRRLDAHPAADADELTELLRDVAAADHLVDAGIPIDLERYDAIGSIRMNADGLARYWRKRREAEAATDPALPGEPVA
jgi:glyoxylase-like metal-dependent hydrolase (beta-lactamase superfamily II)